MNLEERITKVFGERFFVHDHLKQCFELAFSYANSLEKEQHVEIVGPSGSSKSTLRGLLENSLVAPRETWSKGSVPIVSIRASNTSDGFFDSKDFYSRLLFLLGDPFRGGSWSPGAASVNEVDDELERIVRHGAWARLHIRNTETEIRRAAERIAAARGLKFLLVDEAHVMGLVKRERQGVAHLESLRAFAELVGCRLIVLGTYYLLDVWKTSAEINRRLGKVHLRRYRDSNSDELQEFASCVVKLGKHYPFDADDVVRKNFKTIYGLTLGIVGEAHDLLERAYLTAKSSGRQAISATDFLASALSKEQLLTMYQEALIGEERMNQPTNEFLKDLFNARQEGTFLAPKTAQAISGRAIGRPGRRKPARDFIGDQSP